jgi:hypothetical protein
LRPGFGRREKMGDEEEDIGRVGRVAYQVSDFDASDSLVAREKKKHKFV